MLLAQQLLLNYFKLKVTLKTIKKTSVLLKAIPVGSIKRQWAYFTSQIVLFLLVEFHPLNIRCTFQEHLIKSYVVSIFVLKIIDIIHLLYCQMSADLFLLDWERPRPVSTTLTRNSKDGNQGQVPIQLFFKSCKWQIV